ACPWSCRRPHARRLRLCRLGLRPGPKHLVHRLGQTHLPLQEGKTMPMQSKVKTEFCFAYGPVSWVNLDSCDLFGSRDSWNDFKKGGQPFVPVILKLRRRKRNGLRKSRLDGRTLRLKMRLLAPLEAIPCLTLPVANS